MKQFTTGYARPDCAGRLPISGHVMLGNSIASLLAWAGHHPLLQAIAIVFGTFILEDAATVIAAMQASDGSLSAALALASLYVGIALGDLGLYGLGWLAARLPLVARLLPPNRKEAIRAWVDGRVFRVVLVSRFLPGLRLPTYTTCGFVGADLRQFALAVVIATICWTSLLFAVSLRMGEVLLDHFGAWRWAGAAGFILFIIVAGRLTACGLQSRRP
jgi:membrane protein DedA with SNARE-associated domain